MPRYNVLITADTTVSTTVDVEADTPEAAEQKALQEAHEFGWRFDWVRDEGVCSDPYVADPGNSAELDNPTE